MPKSEKLICPSSWTHLKTNKLIISHGNTFKDWKMPACYDVNCYSGFDKMYVEVFTKLLLWYYNATLIKLRDKYYGIRDLQKVAYKKTYGLVT